MKVWLLFYRFDDDLELTCDVFSTKEKAEETMLNLLAEAPDSPILKIWIDEEEVL